VLIDPYLFLPLKIIVDSMHERKIEMAKRVGAFVGLPGGFGTFEEVQEARLPSLTHAHFIMLIGPRSNNLDPAQHS
jgi:predicted Rossmann-fold nucleotide-binding protein